MAASKPVAAVGRGQRGVPDFFLIGVPQSGTTSLYFGLGDHPRIFVPMLKEACHTCPDIDPQTRRNNTTFFDERADYLRLFEAARHDQLIGDGCIYNIYSPQAPGRIRELNLQAKIIVQLRDPIEQMRSNHALKLIMLDLSDADFGRTLASQAALRQARVGAPVNLRDYDLRDKATVSIGLKRFHEQFGRDRVHVSLYEQFANDPEQVFRSIFQFLELDTEFVPTIRVSVPNRKARSDRLNRAMGARTIVDAAKRLVPGSLHPAARRLAAAIFRANRKLVRRQPLDPELVAELRDEFRPEVERLTLLTGLELTRLWWGEGPTDEGLSEREPRRDPSAGRAPQPR